MPKPVPLNLVPPGPPPDDGGGDGGGGHSAAADGAEQTSRSDAWRVRLTSRLSRSGSIASLGSATASLTGKEADDLASAEMLKIRKLENVLFSVIYAMTARSGQRIGFIEMVSSVFGLAISDFFFLISLTASENAWEPAIIVWLNAIQNSLKLYFNVAASWMFWMGCGSVILTGALCAYAWQTFRTNQFPLGVWPIKLLRVAVKLQLTAGYIVLLKLFASGLLCQVRSATYPAAASQRCLDFPNVLYLAVAVVMLLFFLPLCAVLALVYHDSNPRSIDPEARVHGRGELLYLGVRTLGVFFNFFLPSEALINLTIALMTGGAAVYFAAALPFYQPRSNEFRIGLLCAACVFSFGSFVLGFVGSPGDPSKVAASIAFIALTVAAFPAGIAATRLRLRLLEKRHRGPAPVRTAFEEGPKAAPFVLDTDVEVVTRFLREGASPAAVDEARAIFVRGLEQFKTSSFLHLTYAKFLVIYASDSQRALGELKVAWSCKPKFDMRFFLSSIRRDAEQQAHSQNVGDAAGLTYVQILEFRTFYSKAQASHQKTLQLLGGFWGGLRRASFKAPGVIDDVHHKLEEIRLQCDAAQKAYHSILAKFGTSKALLRSYGKFCEDVLIDAEAASTYYRKADELEHRQMLARRAQDRANGIGGGEAGSESESSKQSSSQGSAAMAANRRRIRRPTFTLAAKETKAVKKMSWGILGGMLTLVALGAVLFAVSKLLNTDFSNRVAHSHVISMEAAYLTDVVYDARSLSLRAANISNTPEAALPASFNGTGLDPYAAHVKRFDEAIHEFEHPFIGLWVFSYYPNDIPVVSDPVINDVWTKRPVSLVKVENANPLRTRAKPMALYDAISLLIKAARDFAHAGVESAADPRNNVAFRSLVINAIGQIVPTLAGIAHLVAARLVEASALNRTVVCVLFAINIAFILALCFARPLRAPPRLASRPQAVFEPAFRSVAANQRGVQDILESLPRHFFKERSKHYGKAKACFGAEDNEQSGADEEEEAEERRGGRRARFRAARKGSDSGSDGGGAASDEQGGAASDEQGGAASDEQGGAASDERDGAGSDGGELQEGAAEGAGAGAAGAEDEGEPETPVLPFTAPDDAAPPSGCGSEAAAALRELGGRGSPADSATSREPSVPRVAGIDLVSTESSSRTDSPSGKPKAGDSPASSANAARVPSVAILRQRGVRSFSLDESVAGFASLQPVSLRDLLPPSAGLPGSCDRESACSDEAGLDELLEGLHTGRAPGDHVREALFGEEPPEAPPAAAAARADPSPMVASILRARSEPAAGSEAPSSGEEAAAPAQEAPKEAAAKEKGKAKGAKAEAPPVDARGKSVIAALRKRYVSAFVVIAAIAATNFAVSFYFISYTSLFANDVLYATERRQVAQTAVLYAREAFINDGILADTRERVLEGLATSMESLRTIHVGLKLGNESMGLTGADNRYLPQDKLNYYPVCSIQPAHYGGEPADIDTRDATYGQPCPFATAEERDLYGLGLDVMLANFLQWLADVHAGETCVRNRCSKTGWSRGVADSPEMRALDAMWGPHLKPALDASVDLFLEEIAAKIALVEAVQAAMFAFSVAFLCIIYLLLFRPMVRRLQLESSRTVQLLAMIPKSTVADVRYLQQFFRRSDAADDLDAAA